MIVKAKSSIMLTKNSIMGIPYESVVAIKKNFFIFFFIEDC